MTAEKPKGRLRVFLALYTVLWWVILPVVLIYLALRGRKDALYRQHIGERFGRYPSQMVDPVWIHAISLGELRAAAPLIRALLDRGEKVVTTHFTPAGRRAAQSMFGEAIASGQLVSTWMPFELPFIYKRFFAAFHPKFGLSMEIEVWPRMIAAARDAAVPFYLCNSHYPSRSYDRDMKRFKWRAEVLSLLAGAFIKSDLQRGRFETSGVTDIAVTGEMRFDQAIPADLVTAGEALKTSLGNRTVIALPSVVVGEDDTYLNTISALQGPDAPLFIYIPRAPERFDETANLLRERGLNIARRTEVFDEGFNGTLPQNIDVLLGDSMGEMYFYLAACDLAIIGGGFIEKGAHNVSEPLALGKPCVVGPYTHTIEFPLEEAKAAGVAHQVMDEAALIAYLKTRQFPDSDAAMRFANVQKGATSRTIAALIERGLI